MQRRQFMEAAGALAASAFLPGAARAQAAAPVLDMARILVGFAPGGLSDILARQLADRMRDRYAHNIVVENKPGASGQIAVTQVKESRGDGRVILITHSSSMAMYPFTFAHLPYRPMQDFKPVSMVCYTNHALCVGPAVPASVRNVADFLAWTSEHPDKANYGSPGLGSMPHLIMTVVNKTAGTNLQAAIYRGTAAAITDMLGGQISAVSGPAANFLPSVRGGKARLIAISGDTRSSYAPDVATFREQGFPMTAREWYALYLPASAGPQTVQLATDAARAALAEPDLVASMRDQGVDIASCTPEQLTAMLAADTEEWRRLTREIKFTAES